MAIWPWLVGLAFLLGSALTFALQLLLRRRRERAAAAAAEDWRFVDAPPQLAEPAVAAPQPSVESYALTDDELVEPEHSEPVFFPTADPLPPTPIPTPTFAGAAAHTKVGPLEFSLAARRLSATLMNTVLSYDIVVTNNGDDPIGPIYIGGDMISAHASLPSRAQLEMLGQSIEPLHSLPALAPGESKTLNGDLRLALSAITPIRNGNASLFVPLARFRVEALRKGAPPLVLNHTSVIGESQPAPGAALKPFRLDLGPRNYSDISQRELALQA
jgi:hypothetical protein